MKRGLLAAVATLAMSGCDAIPCRAGTVRLSLRYDGAAAAANRLLLDVTAGVQHRRYELARTSGATRDALEIRFASYQADQPFVVEATAMTGGQPVGTGHLATTLAPSCSALSIALDGPAAAPDQGAPSGDSGSTGGPATDGPTTDGPATGGPATDDPTGDLAGDDLALADLAARDLAGNPTAGDLGPASDLAARDLAASDLAQANTSTVVDLSPPAPDLATPQISFGPSTATAQYPASTLPNFEDACPANQALTGLLVYYDLDASGNRLWVSQIYGTCSAVTLAPSGSGWVAHTSPGVTLPARGGPTTTSAASFPCPSDQFMVGFHGASGAYVDLIGFSCAPLSVGADRSVTVGPIAESQELGGTGGSRFPSTYCPARQVATMTRQRAQGTAPLGGFGFGCSQVVFQ